MKNLQILALAAVLSSAAVPAHADVTFGVAAEPYPPFTAKNAASVWEGWEVDVVQAVCAAMQEKCEIVEVAWDGIIPALQAKKFDVIAASMVINGKRKQVIDFSDMYYGGAFALIGAKDVAASNMTGKTIAVQTASVNADYAEKHYKPQGAEVRVYPTQDDAQADLAAGRVDFVLANALALDAFLMSDTGKSCCESKGTVPADTELGGEVGFGLRKGEAELQTRLNAAIKALAAAGKLDDITAKWNLTGRISLPAP